MKKKLLTRIKLNWDAYLKRLGDANKKNFGEGPLDCCNLNSYEKTGHGNEAGTRHI